MKTVIVTLLLGGLLCGCGPSIPQYNAKMDPPKVYAVTYRTVPPDPVYNRLRWVHLPSPVPGGKELPASQAANIQPLLHIEVKAVKLEKAAQMLAKSASYGSYTASTVADKKITLNRLGTLEDLAQAIASQAGARAVVDHSVRQLRFLGGASSAQ